MADPRLLASFAFGLAASALVIAIGVALARRPVAPGARRAAAAFSAWWIGLGVNALLSSAVIAVGRLYPGSPALAPLVYAQLFAISVMLWGLVYYLVYLFTGRASTFWPITAFYVASYVAGTAFIASLGPNGVTPSPWGGAVSYVNEPSASAGTLFAAFFLLPPILGALAYGTLFFRLRAPTQRYRVGIVSTSLVVWFGSSLVIGALGAGSSDVANVLTRAIGFTSIGTIWLAYHPPARVREWLGISGLREDGRFAPAPEETEGAIVRRAASDPRANRAKSLAERARELV